MSRMGAPSAAFYWRFVAATVGILCLTHYAFAITQPKPWPNLLLFLLPLLVSIFRPNLGFCFFLSFLAFSEGIFPQLRVLTGISLPTMELTAIDCGAGFLLGYWIRQAYFKKANTFLSPPSAYRGLLYWVATIFHLLLVINVAIAIEKNLYDAASAHSLRGLFFNISKLRFLGWHDDYFPLRQLFAFSSALVIFQFLLTEYQTFIKPNLKIILRALYVPAVVICVYGILTRWLGIGYFRDGATAGINSFLPDLHSFAAYAFALFAGSLHFATSTKGRSRIYALTFAALAAISIFFSYSANIIGFSALVAVFFTLKAVFNIKEKFKRVWICLLSLGALTVAGILAEKVAYQAFDKIFRLLRSRDFNSFNAAGSDRPEIFLSALKIFSDFPWTGIGLGSFLRYSSNFELTGSSYLMKNGGENAHNFFLQILAETGVFATLAILTILLLGLVAKSEKGKSGGYSGFLKATLIAMILSNLYGHPWLINSLLMLALIVVAIIVGDAKPSTPNIFEYHRAAGWSFTLGILIIGSLTTYEAMHFSGKIPFLGQPACYLSKTTQNLGGFHVLNFTPNAKSVEFSIDPVQDDVGRRPLEVAYKLKDGINGTEIKSGTITFVNRNAENLVFDLANLQHDKKYILELRASRCFTPLNFGINFDRNRYGFALAGTKNVTILN